MWVREVRSTEVSSKMLLEALWSKALSDPRSGYLLRVDLSLPAEK